MKNDPKSMTSEPMKKTIDRRPGLICDPREGGGVACGATVTSGSAVDTG